MVLKADPGGEMSFLDLFRRELTQDRFAAIVLRRMSRMRGFGAAAYDREAFSIGFRDPHESSMTFNLHNAFKDYQKANRKDRDGLLDRYLGAFSAPPDRYNREVALLNLMPVIRDKAMFEYALLTGRLSGINKPSNVTPTKPFMDHLVIALVVDSADSVVTVTQGKLEEWGVEFEFALKLAMDNLRDRTRDSFRTNGRGVFV